MFCRNKDKDSKEPEERIVNGHKFLLEAGTSRDCDSGRTLAADIARKFASFNEVTFEDFKTKRKELVDTLSKFDKHYLKFVKDGCYDEVCKKGVDFGLAPLKVAVEASYNLKKIESLEASKKEVPSFKKKAVKACFIKGLNELTELLFKIGKIECKIDTETVLSRFDLSNWQNIPPMWFLISKLQKHLNLLRELFQQRTETGEDHWHYDLALDKELHDHLMKIIKLERNCSIFLGDALKRDQLLFLHHIVKSISEVKVSKEDRTNQIIKPDTIPKLAAFRLLINMWSINARKISEKKVHDESMKKYGQQFEVLEKKAPVKEEEEEEEEFKLKMVDFELEKYGVTYSFRDIICLKGIFQISLLKSGRRHPS